MISSGVLTVFGVAGLVLVFAVVQGRRGSAAALLSLCWVPLVALIVGVAAQQRLGYGVLVLLMAVVVSSVALMLVGAVLTIRAYRMGAGSFRALAAATAIAAAPIVIMLGAWMSE